MERDDTNERLTVCEERLKALKEHHGRRLDRLEVAFYGSVGALLMLLGGAVVHFLVP